MLDWNKDEANNSSFHDINIGDFEMGWNLNGGELYAISDTSVNEMECIHTSQELEFNCVVVIIVEDIRCENGKELTDYT